MTEKGEQSIRKRVDEYANKPDKSNTKAFIMNSLYAIRIYQRFQIYESK